MFAKAIRAGFTISIMKSFSHSFLWISFSDSSKSPFILHSYIFTSHFWVTNSFSEYWTTFITE